MLLIFCTLTHCFFEQSFFAHLPAFFQRSFRRFAAIFRHSLQRSPTLRKADASLAFQGGHPICSLQLLELPLPMEEAARKTLESKQQKTR
jgi:hypothetical protein